MAERERIDTLLVRRGYFAARERAQRAILSGDVRIGDTVVDKPGTRVENDAEISIKTKPRYVSRGAEKLAKALRVFQIDVNGRVCLDIGASTGGFTDVLLKAGARLVIAVDVGYGQLAWVLRTDPRVIVLERTNIRYLEPAALPEPVDLAAADVSFISLTKVVPKVLDLAKPDARLVLLIKPQFEAGRRKVGKGGIVRDRATHTEVLTGLIAFLEREGLQLEGLTYSPVTGADGNIEFLVYLNRKAEGAKRRRRIDIQELIGKVVEEAHQAFKK